ncbi:HGGxSTG domain-containing protein [Mycobacterium intracellulare]|uniref:HGGxSTG domain-containing protein n=1 Tax=Mycobacterium intracellulare TaxID=1767 RepID=UPI000BAAC309|nr:HGGxSTG domain-containing protein [Mycobacterium intracellulare]ASW93901.1 hypothetical protein CKJ67_03490 [Mycobacterium intracellulare]MCA2232720.1 hypothetical protein [Mycobacterium intracellulare]PBA20785.1 hypothetical protein CKJ68_03555 [Mycobacterium intracellulare]
MSTNHDDNGIIDVEAEEIEDRDNLPAVVTHEHTEPITKWSEEWWATQSPHTQSRRCRAHSIRTGEPCKNMAILGATVCRFHGGAAPHVKRAARARIENAADLMAKELLKIALTADSEGVALAAVKDALDRSGLKAPSEVVLSQGEAKPYETVFDSIGGNPSEPIRYDGTAGHKASPAPAYGDTGYAGLQPVAEENREPSSDSESLRQAERRQFDRDSQPGPRDEARPQRPPARREMHITGMAAIRIANEANSAAGVFEEQRAIESPHKRYRRP